MSAGRRVSAENPSARRKAELELHRYPFPDGRQSVARELVAFIKNDACVVWPSALKLAFRAGVSEVTAQRALADFDRTGLTVRLPDFEFPADDPDDDEAKKHRRRVARRVDMHRLHELYPENVGWNEFRDTNRAKQQKCDRKRSITAPCGNSPDASITAPCGNSHASGTREARVHLPHDADSFTANGAVNYRIEERHLPHETPSFTSPCGTSVLERLQSGLPERPLSGPQSPGTLVDFAARSSTDVPPANGASRAAQNPVVQAMVEAFFEHCESKDRSAVEDACLRLASNGASVDDMREAIGAAQRKQKDGRRPRLAAVRNTLDGVLRTRESVVSAPAHAFSEETVRAARRLEAIYADEFDKPGWNANRDRWDMGEWLLRAIAWHNVDEAMFEAACRDAKKKANGKTPTWRAVRDALDARIRARAGGVQQAAGGQSFFDRPASAAGTCVLPGNETRH
ncbi:hypothetical protein G3N95_36150 [Paraburkholderia sp. Tr-20389]|uniref:hypothetical protein n=1 Tax=Paraburkholderia sp. Tr-20389 TaxID=2703903 RepID=UPI00197FF385|nr:hypothetical protein [Paraburkholderia sp. Tr-20389]MBN3758389.1 hypothetical protein [Paraburkholderia sp. Tr-20389]